jgi:hypothetical protein
MYVNKPEEIPDQPKFIWNNKKHRRKDLKGHWGKKIKRK